MFLMAKKAFVKGQESSDHRRYTTYRTCFFTLRSKNMSKEQLKRLYEATPYAVIRSYDIEQKNKLL